MAGRPPKVLGKRWDKPRPLFARLRNADAVALAGVVALVGVEEVSEEEAAVALVDAVTEVEVEGALDEEVAWRVRRLALPVLTVPDNAPFLYVFRR